MERPVLMAVSSSPTIRLLPEFELVVTEIRSRADIPKYRNRETPIPPKRESAAKDGTNGRRCRNAETSKKVNLVPTSLARMMTPFDNQEYMCDPPQ